MFIPVFAELLHVNLTSLLPSIGLTCLLYCIGDLRLPYCPLTSSDGSDWTHAPQLLSQTTFFFTSQGQHKLLVVTITSQQVGPSSFSLLHHSLARTRLAQ